ncbi:MAG: antitoxin Xre/MbcA/ParS toxin-binding domain-containing protein [Longimicrobiales bacterium]
MSGTRKRGSTPKRGVAHYYALRLESARRAFDSDAKVAEALGVNRAQVKRWREGETEPGPGNAERVIGLDAAVELLSGYLEPSSAAKWLMGHNAHLGDRRPVDLLREGNLSGVIAAIEALKSGAYA